MIWQSDRFSKQRYTRGASSALQYEGLNGLACTSKINLNFWALTTARGQQLAAVEGSPPRIELMASRPKSQGSKVATETKHGM